MSKEIEEYVRTLGLDAYVVGGAVRDALIGIDAKDADFLVPGLDIAGLRSTLAAHGRTEPLTVAGRAVGVRFYPADRALRRKVPAGIELAPARREVSTGPGRHDFEIAVDPRASVEDDLARRDFTINAMARRLSDDTLVDPFGGRADLDGRVLRTVSESSFAEDPLRLVRGLRFVSQLDLDPAEQTLEQMRSDAGSVRLVSGERVGGGLAADGLGELSKLLLGAKPLKALRLARDTGVLVVLLPELERSIGFDQESAYHGLTVDEHTFAVVQAAADAGFPLRVRLAALFHDAGKPYVAWRGKDGRLHYYAKAGKAERAHEQVSAELTRDALARLRYPAETRRRVVQIVRHHMLSPRGDAARARRLLARFGEELTTDLLDHKEADLRGKWGPGEPPPEEQLEQLAQLRRIVEAERGSPHRLRDLAINGADLLELGYAPGPAVGATLRTLLAEVVDQPARNTRTALLARAEELRTA
ncbi:MAG TPA: HD domain-containing protein [Gaiellaceae bacterium]|nr:HD domain-containing protein [Gaiellaceae bacterium]